MTCTLIASASTTVGRRKRNEDAYVLDAELGLFAVADGMGGYSGGEVASHIAVTSLAEFWAASVDTDNTWPYAFDRSLGLHENRIDAAVRLANRRICARREGELRNMGSTLAALIVRPKTAIVAHLGDSRIYRLRGGVLTQLTRDHSLYEQLRETGADLPPLDQYAYANVVTRALGAAEHDRPELQTLDLVDGDRYLVCSDGLSGVLGPAEITALLADTAIEAVADALVEAAFAAGSRDNITAIVVHVQQRP
ncbi:protein phosphatase 2C domain-containing protein [Nannocystis sp.]|uniref:PP2C family protein-serine/threonine phosphatase n=1 Tax=Nannocystis sp. TaxID=1962667 RepID=UPI0025EDB727|nr:protein phosphatase 2C domain-containing protein [Nannocystis sp.]MBK7827491.1 serine/threonine-protein phosphatase [Nannocystis sp.]